MATIDADAHVIEVAPIGEPEVYGVQAWKDAFKDSGLWVSFWNTIKVAVALLLIAFPLSAFIAWLLARTNIPFAHGFKM